MKFFKRKKVSNKIEKKTFTEEEKKQIILQMKAMPGEFIPYLSGQINNEITKIINEYINTPQNERKY